MCNKGVPKCILVLYLYFVFKVFNGDPKTNEYGPSPKKKVLTKKEGLG